MLRMRKGAKPSPPWLMAQTHLALGAWHVMLGIVIWHLALGTWHLALGTWHLALGTCHSLALAGTCHLILANRKRALDNRTNHQKTWTSPQQIFHDIISG